MRLVTLPATPRGTPAYVRLRGVKGSLRRVENADSPLTPLIRTKCWRAPMVGQFLSRRVGQFS